MAENRKLEISDFLAEVLYYRPNDRAAIRHVLDEFGQLERALDKACEELHSKDLDEEKSDFMKKYTVWSKEQWKEWCLKDD